MTMATSSLWQKGTGPQAWHVPAGGERCPSCPFPPRPTARLEEKCFAKGEGGACVSRGLRASIALVGIRHGENAAENREEMPCGDPSQERGFSTLAPHQCLPDSGMREEQAQSLLPRLISCPLSLLLPSQGNRTSWQCHSVNSKLRRLSLN